MCTALGVLFPRVLMLIAALCGLSVVCLVPPEQVASRCLTDDFCDLEFFVELVKALVANGINVAIASFGHYAVIQVRCIVNASY